MYIGTVIHLLIYSDFNIYIYVLCMGNFYYRQSIDNS